MPKAKGTSSLKRLHWVLGAFLAVSVVVLVGIGFSIQYRDLADSDFLDEKARDRPLRADYREHPQEQQLLQGPDARDRQRRPDPFHQRPRNRGARRSAVRRGRGGGAVEKRRAHRIQISGHYLLRPASGLRHLRHLRRVRVGQCVHASDGVRFLRVHALPRRRRRHPRVPAPLGQDEHQQDGKAAAHHQRDQHGVRLGVPAARGQHGAGADSPVDAAFGVCTIEGEGMSFDQAFEVADKEMYRDKKASRAQR